MAGDALKVIKCEHCGQHTAHIKKRGNSALMYLHCVNKECRDVNQSSAPGFQRKLKAALESDSENKTGNSGSPEWKPTKATQSTTGADLTTEKPGETSLEEAEKKPSYSMAIIGMSVALLAAFAGVKIKGNP